MTSNRGIRSMSSPFKKSGNVVVEVAITSKRIDKVDLTIILRNVQTPSYVISNFQLLIFNDQHTFPSFINGTNIAIKRTKVTKMHTFFSICLGVILENNPIANINKKYSPKSLIRVIGVSIMHRIIERNEMIFVLGSSFSSKLLACFIMRIKQQERKYIELLYFNQAAFGNNFFLCNYIP